MKTVLHVLSLLIIAAFWPTAADAKKGGGGKPGTEPPSASCDDVFPGFLFVRDADRNSPVQWFIASSDGCRSLPIETGIALNGRGPWLAVNDSGSELVVAWVTRIGETAPYDYHLERRDYRFDDKGTTDHTDDQLVMTGATSAQLPTAIEAGFPAGDEMYYYAGDLWSTGDLGGIYLAMDQMQRTLGTEVPNIRRLLVFELNMDPDLSDPVTIDNGHCPAASAYPQFIPYCHDFRSPRWSPGGDRLYVSSGFQDGTFVGTLAIDVTQPDASISNWVFSDPRLVFVGINGYEDFTEVRGNIQRPGGGSGIPTEIGIRFLDRTGKHTVAARALLDVDVCLDQYAALAAGDTYATNDHWLNCISSDRFDGDPLAWQAREALIVRVSGSKRGSDILSRVLFFNGASPVTEPLVEDGFLADTGL